MWLPEAQTLRSNVIFLFVRLVRDGEYTIPSVPLVFDFIVTLIVDDVASNSAINVQQMIMIDHLGKRIIHKVYHHYQMQDICLSLWKTKRRFILCETS